MQDFWDTSRRKLLPRVYAKMKPDGVVKSPISFVVGFWQAMIFVATFYEFINLDPVRTSMETAVEIMKAAGELPEKIIKLDRAKEGYPPTTPRKWKSMTRPFVGNLAKPGPTMYDICVF